MKIQTKSMGVIVAVLGLTTAAFANGTSKAISSIFKIKEAEAICCSSPANNGRCSFSGNCFGNLGGAVDCESTLGHCDATGTRGLSNN